MRILVVDDELDTAQTIAFLLSDSGHEVRYAVNGRSALILAEQLQPDVIVLDLGLPDMDGIELARRINRAGSSSRIIAITGRAKEAESAVRQAGCEAFLQKPVDPKQLERLISG